MALASSSDLLSVLDKSSTKYKILEAIAEEEKNKVNTTIISEKLAVSEKTVRNNLTFLVQNNLVIRPERDSYKVNPGIFSLIKICMELFNEVNNK